MRQDDYTMNLVCFLAGALAGATFALLTAPQSGRRTRRMIRDSVEDGVESFVETGHDLQRRGKRIAQDATEFADRVKHATTR